MSVRTGEIMAEFCQYATWLKISVISSFANCLRKKCRFASNLVCWPFEMRRKLLFLQHAVLTALQHMWLDVTITCTSWTCSADVCILTITGMLSRAVLHIPFQVFRTTHSWLSICLEFFLQSTMSKMSCTCWDVSLSCSLFPNFPCWLCGLNNNLREQKRQRQKSLPLCFASVFLNCVFSSTAC